MAKKRKFKLAPHLPEEAMEGVGGMQKTILDLHVRGKKPKNKEEEELLKQIKEGEKKGFMLDLPLE